ncbi:MAG: site-2 protease family protein [Polyangiaceae bacterium]|nr:site-2 protease family protein [Polyangiaceae bacterium]
MFYIVALLGLGLLMVVHEGGHLLAARAFGMRVIRFSVGFGPALWRYQPSGSQTVYQVALIPFLAYVQIAGMNPMEEVDPDDKGSYANAPVRARISAIFAGPLANYLFASVLFFTVLMVGGKPAPPTTEIEIMPEGPAKTAKLQDHDKVRAIDGKPVRTWDALRETVLANPGRTLRFEIERKGERRVVPVTPKRKDGGGFIGVRPVPKMVPVTFGEAARGSVVAPAGVVREFVVVMGKIVTGQQRPELTGPVGIVRETKRVAERSWIEYLYVLAVLSAYLGAFNLVPFPALDGGRLMFLGYEATTRRRPNAKVEAQIHAIGLLMLLMLIAVVSIFDIKGP